MTEVPPERQRESAADEFGLSAVRELLQMLSDTDVTEIQIERGDVRLLIRRSSSASVAQIAPAQPLVVAHSAPAPQSQLNGQPAAPGAAPASPAGEQEPLPPGNVVTAPMVGTFYAAASPKDPPFVTEGDVIHVGDKVGINEAMKMMNEIESEFAGRVVRVLVKNGQPVEYGQPLMVIEPV